MNQEVLIINFFTLFLSFVFFYLFFFYQRLKLKDIFLFWKGKIYIYCRISCTINPFIITSYYSIFCFVWRQRLCYIYCIPQIVKWNLCNKVFGSPFTCEKGTCVTLFWIPSTCGLTFNEWVFFWFKQNFIQDKIKIQRIVMCSSTSCSL